MAYGGDDDSTSSGEHQVSRRVDVCGRGDIQNDCTATAHVNNQAPPQKFTEIVTGVLTWIGASPQGTLMHTVWHEKSATKTCGGTADVTGQADCSKDD